MHDYQNITRYLYSLRNRGSKYGIERMQTFATALGNPELKLSIIHVAGTNGKGSVCAMLEALYRDNGYKTGLFTSPHLVRLNERLQINRTPIGDKQLSDYTRKLSQVVEELLEKNILDETPSFFEFITAIAFHYFFEEQVDIAIIETGLGGRLDATNIATPELSIITSIGLDHTDILGNTLKQIAFEKAGIIKKNQPVLIGKLPREAKTVVAEQAEKKSAPIYYLEERFEMEPLPKTNLLGSYQKHNAGLALFATEILHSKFPIETTHALCSVKWDGRWHTIHLNDKTVILDATHNQEACLQLEENLKALSKKLQKNVRIISGIVGTERAKEIIPRIAKFAHSFYFVQVDQPKACQTSVLKSFVPTSFQGLTQCVGVTDLFSKGECLIGEPNDVIVVTGSIYLIGEIITIIQGKEADPIGQDKLHPN